MMHLKEGDVAPVINALDENGTPISLSDYKGKKVVLYFYPKDLTPGCTVESCDLRDNYQKFLAQGYEIIGVSADSQEKHKKFIAKHDLPFHLIADTDKKVIQDYGVWGEKKFMGKTYNGIHRTTFVISEKGVINQIITKVKTKEHTNQILAN